MLFRYTAITSEGEEKKGVIEAVSADLAVAALQRRGLVVADIVSSKEKKWYEITFFERVKT